jgi:peptidoglycan/LPS O-acetylase OafA/YrhL
VRILPPLVVFFLLVIFMYRPELWRLPFYIGFAANIMEALKPVPGHGEFVILWSLAVEEHFYLLWPIAVRFLSWRRLIQISAAILVMDPLLRFIATPWFHDFLPIYMLTPFQIDGLAAGSLLALLDESERPRLVLTRWAGLAVIFMIALYSSLSYLIPSFYRNDNTRLFNGGGYTLLVFGMAAVLASIYYHPKSLPSRILASPPVFFMGSISYGFYLYHRVMQDISARLIASIFSVPHGRWAQPVGFLLAIGLSWLSFHFYEKPIIRWGRRLAESPGDAKSVPLPDV